MGRTDQARGQWLPQTPLWAQSQLFQYPWLLPLPSVFLANRCPHGYLQEEGPLGLCVTTHFIADTGPCSLRAQGTTWLPPACQRNSRPRGATPVSP